MLRAAILNVSICVQHGPVKVTVQKRTPSLVKERRQQQTEYETDYEAGQVSGRVGEWL
jgi:hypothetical protein